MEQPLCLLFRQGRLPLSLEATAIEAEAAGKILPLSKLRLSCFPSIRAAFV